MAAAARMIPTASVIVSSIKEKPSALLHLSGVFSLLRASRLAVIVVFRRTNRLFAA